MVILHYFIIENYNKNRPIVTLFPFLWLVYIIYALRELFENIFPWTSLEQMTKNE